MSILHHHRSEFDRVFLSLLTERDAHEQINWFLSCLFSSLIVCSCKWWSSASEIWRRRWPIRITRPSQNPWKRPHFRSFSAAFQIGCPTCHQETNYHDYSQECRPSEFHYITFQYFPKKSIPSTWLPPVWLWILWRNDGSPNGQNLWKSYRW